MKKYIIIAGVNGSGKTTLYQAFSSIKGMKRINTDDILREQGGNWKDNTDVMKAGKIAVARIKDYFNNGQSFNQETTLCGRTIIRNIRKAKLLGYVIEMHYIGLDSAEVAKERVDARVKVGGHGIPAEDIERRYVQSFKNLKKVQSLCDELFFYDNTKQFERFAFFSGGKEIWSKKTPHWFDKWIKE